MSTEARKSGSSGDKGQVAGGFVVKRMSRVNNSCCSLLDLLAVSRSHCCWCWCWCGGKRPALCAVSAVYGANVVEWLGSGSGSGSGSESEWLAWLAMMRDAVRLQDGDQGQHGEVSCLGFFFFWLRSEKKKKDSQAF